MSSAIEKLMDGSEKEIVDSMLENIHEQIAIVIGTNTITFSLEFRLPTPRVLFLLKSEMKKFSWFRKMKIEDGKLLIFGEVNIH